MEHRIRASVKDACGPKLSTKFRILSVPRPNKRVQLMKGIMAATTPLVALSDDDAVWTPNFLSWMVAPFDDQTMGGVGSRQEMMPVGNKATSWEVIADFRLTMRMIEASATTLVDGGMSCLSGRTAVYRRKILTDPSFGVSFVNEKWLGKYRLHSGDDKFLTRWIVSHGWNMQLQNHRDALLLTTFKDNRMFLKQVLRWTRNTWRSDLRSLFIERKIWTKHPYVAFNMCDKLINPLPILYSLIVIGYNMVQRTRQNYLHILVPVFAWIMLSRFIKLLPHVIQKPRHIVYVPVMVLFQYVFPFLKLYALCTLHITDWGSRRGVDTEDFKEEDWRVPARDDMCANEHDEDEVDHMDYENHDWTRRQKIQNCLTLTLGWFVLSLTVFCFGLLVFFTHTALTEP